MAIEDRKNDEDDTVQTAEKNCKKMTVVLTKDSTDLKSKLQAYKGSKYFNTAVEKDITALTKKCDAMVAKLQTTISKQPTVKKFKAAISDANDLHKEVVQQLRELKGFSGVSGVGCHLLISFMAYNRETLLLITTLFKGTPTNPLIDATPPPFSRVPLYSGGWC